MTLTYAAAPSAFASAPDLENEMAGGRRERFISYDEVHDRTGLSRTTIWRLEKIKDFPQSVGSLLAAAPGGRVISTGGSHLGWRRSISENFATEQRRPDRHRERRQNSIRFAFDSAGTVGRQGQCELGTAYYSSSHRRNLAVDSSWRLSGPCRWSVAISLSLSLPASRTPSQHLGENPGRARAA